MRLHSIATKTMSGVAHRQDQIDDSSDLCDSYQNNYWTTIRFIEAARLNKLSLTT